MKDSFYRDKYNSASKCTYLKCEICEYAKAHRRPTKGSTHQINPKTEWSLRARDLRARNTVLVDHFKSQFKERTVNSHDRLAVNQYVSGFIFVHHISSYLHVEHQLRFLIIETIQTKQNFEKLAYKWSHRE